MQLVDAVAEKLKKIIEKRKLTASFVRNYQDFFKEVNSNALSYKLAAIDGGFATNSYFFVDLVLMKAACVVYDVVDNKLRGIEAYPKKEEMAHATIEKGLNEIELNLVTNLIRQRSEIEMAIEAAEKFSPNFLALDGSIIPHYSYSFNSPFVQQNFEETVQAYRTLFNLCKNKKIVLFGIVKNSRGKRFLEFLASKGLLLDVEARDISLLNFALSKNERTISFKYSEDTSAHPILKHFEERDDIYSFYLKNAKEDFPLRIDFLSIGNREKIADEIAQIVCRFTFDERNNLPSFMIEVDRKARIKEQEAKRLNKLILSKIGFLAFKEIKKF